MLSERHHLSSMCLVLHTTYMHVCVFVCWCVFLPQLLEDDDVHNEKVRVMQGQNSVNDIVVIKNMSKVCLLKENLWSLVAQSSKY